MSTAAALYWPFPVDLVREWPGTRPAGMAPHWGTDFAVDAGTPVPATSDGRIVYVGDDGLGGYTIDLLRDDGLLQRFGHLAWGSGRVRVGQRVTAGEIIALSGYSGAVIPKGPPGSHLHWECRWDRAWSAGRWVDPRTLNPESLGDDMSAKAESEIANTYQGLWYGGSVKIDGQVQTFNYGVLPIVAHSQAMIAQLIGQVGALTAAVQALPGGGQVDMAALEAAAEKGAREALSGLTLKAEVNG